MISIGAKLTAVLKRGQALHDRDLLICQLIPFPLALKLGPN